MEHNIKQIYNNFKLGKNVICYIKIGIFINQIKYEKYKFSVLRHIGQNKSIFLL